MYQPLLILGMGLCTFLPRYLPLVLFQRRALPAWVRTVLAYLPPALLAAIAIPSMLAPTGSTANLSFTSPYLLAGVATIVAGLLLKRFMLVWTVGITTFFLLHWWLAS